jgi:hypothetical protein
LQEQRYSYLHISVGLAKAKPISEITPTNPQTTPLGKIHENNKKGFLEKAYIFFPIRANCAVSVALNPTDP